MDVIILILSIFVGSLTGAFIALFIFADATMGEIWDFLKETFFDLFHRRI